MDRPLETAAISAAQLGCDALVVGPPRSTGLETGEWHATARSGREDLAAAVAGVGLPPQMSALLAWQGSLDTRLREGAREHGIAALDGPTLDHAEAKRMIRRALNRHRGNVSRAAVALGLSRSALYRRLQRHGLSP